MYIQVSIGSNWLFGKTYNDANYSTDANNYTETKGRLFPSITDNWINTGAFEIQRWIGILLQPNPECNCFSNVTFNISPVIEGDLVPYPFPWYQSIIYTLTVAPWYALIYYHIYVQNNIHLQNTFWNVPPISDDGISLENMVLMKCEEKWEQPVCGKGYITQATDGLWIIPVKTNKETLILVVYRFITIFVFDIPRPRSVWLNNIVTQLVMLNTYPTNNFCSSTRYRNALIHRGAVIWKNDSKQHHVRNILYSAICTTGACVYSSEKATHNSHWCMRVFTALP